ncbi:MAG TPA: NAD(P)-dependent oxidoreductase [Terriglobia bacterium]|jgi:3-hydroxyisobutyrate dehydrogenase/2-hydroxy-3-oxopropionate reductase|nr:NAD(P)-dependent oxidoreductase [Terriglobia bacterium]
MSQSVGFIGLGIMGQPMALNLVKAGFKVTAYNRTPGKAEALKAAGAAVAASPAEAARAADYVVIIVSDSAAVEEVVTGKNGVIETIRPGAIVIDSSTISPVVSRRLACHLAGKGAKMLDAPVTGSKHGAEKGELTFMIGGEKETFEQAMPVLKVLGKKHIYCGQHGLGLSAKLAMNSILATMIAIFAEGFVLAAKAGVPPATLLEIMQSSLARNGIVDFKAPFVFKGDFTPYFPLKLMHKDLELAMETAYAQNVPMPTTAAVKEVYGVAKAQGKGDLDYAAVITYLEEVAGAKVRSN